MHYLLVAMTSTGTVSFRLIMARHDYNKVKATYEGFPILTYSQASSIVNFQLPSDCSFFLTDGTEDVYAVGSSVGFLREAVAADREWFKYNNPRLFLK